MLEKEVFFFFYRIAHLLTLMPVELTNNMKKQFIKKNIARIKIKTLKI